MKKKSKSIAGKKNLPGLNPALNLKVTKVNHGSLVGQSKRSSSQEPSSLSKLKIGSTSMKKKSRRVLKKKKTRPFFSDTFYKQKYFSPEADKVENEDSTNMVMFMKPLKELHPSEIFSLNRSNSQEDFLQTMSSKLEKQQKSEERAMRLKKLRKKRRKGDGEHSHSLNRFSRLSYMVNSNSSPHVGPGVYNIRKEEFLPNKPYNLKGSSMFFSEYPKPSLKLLAIKEKNESRRIEKIGVASSSKKFYSPAERHRKFKNSLKRFGYETSFNKKKENDEKRKKIEQFMRNSRNNGFGKLKISLKRRHANKVPGSFSLQSGSLITKSGTNIKTTKNDFKERLLKGIGVDFSLKLKTTSFKNFSYFKKKKAAGKRISVGKFGAETLKPIDDYFKKNLKINNFGRREIYNRFSHPPQVASLEDNRYLDYSWIDNTRKRQYSIGPNGSDRVLHRGLSGVNRTKSSSFVDYENFEARVTGSDFGRKKYAPKDGSFKIVRRRGLGNSSDGFSLVKKKGFNAAVRYKVREEAGSSKDQQMLSSEV